MARADDQTARGPSPVARQIALTRAGLWAERVAHRFWPAWTLALAAIALWSTDVLTPPWRGGLLVAVGLALLAAVIWGLRGFAAPSHAEARACLDATLPGRPLRTLDDEQVVGAGDSASRAVWAAHRARMADRLRGARAVPPTFEIRRRDPYALRYMALLLAALGLLFGTVWRAPDLPDLGPGATAVASGPAWEAWLEPPRHTGRPTLYLNDIPPGQVELPVGTRITVRLYDPEGRLSVSETVSGRDVTAPIDPMQEFELRQSGTLAIDGAEDGPVWTLTALPDARPEVSFDGEARFEMPDRVSLPWAASDDHGITAAEARFALDAGAADRRFGLAPKPEPRDPLVLDMALPISGDRTEFSETLLAELSQHPLAGMPVTATLRVADAAGQSGEAVRQIILPARPFYDPVAGALIEQRRDLFWSRANRMRVARVLRAVTWKADDVFDNPPAYLIVRMAIRRLEAGALSPEARDEIAAMLWEAAVRLEENSLDSAAERLRQAQERLSEAIRQGASPEEIARLTEEMRRAMDDYTRQLAQSQGQQDGGQQQAQGEMQEVTPDMLDQMMQRIEELMAQGRIAEAQELLQQLQEMMENLQVTQGQGGQGQPGQGEQAMDGLRDQLRQQQELSDEAFRELQEQFGQQQGRQPGQSNEQPGEGDQPGQGEGDQPGQGQQFGQDRQGRGQGQGQGQGQQPGGAPDAESLARRQQALREGLEELRGNLPGAGTEAGDAARESLGRAEDAMRDAERDLADNNLGGALDDQARAMDALRDGMQELGRALVEDRPEGAPGQDPGEGQRGGQVGQAGNRDPLGRESGEGGRLGTDDEMIGGIDPAQRARDLMDEIRRRSGERERPELELDYLRRLLDRF